MKLLSPEDLKALGISFRNPHRHTLERDGKFPKRVRLGDRRYAYVEEEIQNWLKGRAALREAT
jgi:predicted DNA-binding transcriptional regulator AlpA